jgi:hypothetical protein
VSPCRVAFDNVYKKMERELHEKKKEMANIIEISNIAYEAGASTPPLLSST